MVASVKNTRTFRLIAHRPFDRPIPKRLPSVHDYNALADSKQ